MLVDNDTGRILDQSNDAMPVTPASLSKMFTALVAAAYLPPSSMVTSSADAASLEPDKIGMMPGQVWTYPEVVQALLLISANDAAYNLAEKIAGTAAAFGPIVERAAIQMGITDHPVFNDPAGLDDTPGSIGGGNLINARDLAIAARDLLADPRLAPIVALPTLRYTGPQGTVYGLANVNGPFLRSYPGAIGVKTGYTIRAGPCIAAAATRGGRTMLAVVLHGANTNQTASMLLDRGFATPAAAEPAAEALPAISLPTPPPDGPPAPPVSLPAPTVSGGGDHRLASGLTPGGDANLGGHSIRSLSAASVAALLLALVGIIAVRRMTSRRRPLAHGRRR